jgi:hypothetical protein
MEKMMSSDTKDVIELGNPEADSTYKTQIENAKKSLSAVDALKGKSVLGHIERPRMPYLGPMEKAEVSPFGPEGGVSPRPPGSPVIRQETKAALAAMEEATKKELKKAEEKSKDEVKKEEAEDLFDMLDMDSRSEAERILNNKNRRKEIEKRCTPMNIEDLIWKDEVRQLVPVVPGKFEVEFRSITSQENLFLKQFIAKEATTTDMYLVEKLGICQVTCALVSINGKPLPDHRSPDGAVDETLFKEKFKKVAKMSSYVVGDLGINYMWFDIRVRKLINPDVLGNG